jgi:hypothetical protein
MMINLASLADRLGVTDSQRRVADRGDIVLIAGTLGMIKPVLGDVLEWR